MPEPYDALTQTLTHTPAGANGNNGAKSPGEHSFPDQTAPNGRKTAPWHFPDYLGVKCALFTGAVALMYVLILFLFRLEAVAAEFSEYSAAMLAGMLALGNVTFLLFDRILARFSLLYRRKRKLIS